MYAFHKGISAVKSKQPVPGFKIESPCQFPKTITITPQAPSIYIYIYIYRSTVQLDVKGCDASYLLRGF